MSAAFLVIICGLPDFRKASSLQRKLKNNLFRQSIHNKFYPYPWTIAQYLIFLLFAHSLISLIFTNNNLTYIWLVTFWRKWGDRQSSVSLFAMMSATSCMTQSITQGSHYFESITGIADCQYRYRFIDSHFLTQSVAKSQSQSCKISVRVIEL